MVNYLGLRAHIGSFDELFWVGSASCGAGRVGGRQLGAGARAGVPYTKAIAAWLKLPPLGVV